MFCNFRMELERNAYVWVSECACVRLYGPVRNRGRKEPATRWNINYASVDVYRSLTILRVSDRLKTFQSAARLTFVFTFLHLIGFVNFDDIVQRV